MAERAGTVYGRLNPYRLEAIRRHAAREVLDVGCGNGAYVRHLGQRGYSIVGLDLLSYPEWHDLGDRVLVGDAGALPFRDRAFETVLAFEVLEHVTDIQPALHELWRVARRNVILSVPDCETPPALLTNGLVYSHWRDRTHVQFFTEATLLETLARASFRVVTHYRINPILMEPLVLDWLRIPGRWRGIVEKLLARWRPHRWHMTWLVVTEPLR